MLRTSPYRDVGRLAASPARGRRIPGALCEVLPLLAFVLTILVLDGMALSVIGPLVVHSVEHTAVRMQAKRPVRKTPSEGPSTKESKGK